MGEAKKRREQVAQRPPIPEVALSRQMTLPERALQSAVRGMDGFWKLAERLRQDPNMLARPCNGAWNTWCYLPVNVVAGIVAHLVRDHMSESDVETYMVGQTRLLTAVSAWRMTKGVYVFDPSLLKALAESEVDEEFPDELFMRLPDWCPYISTPGFQVREGLFLHGFFAYIDDRAWGNRNSYPPELNFELLVDPKLSAESELALAAANDTNLQRRLGEEGLEGLDFVQMMQRAAELAKEREFVHIHTQVPLGQGAFSEAYRAQNNQLGKQIPAIADVMNLAGGVFGEAISQQQGQMQARLASLLLYLVSDKADIQPEADRAEGRSRVVSNERRGIRNFQAPQIRPWEVGYRIGAEIRAFDEKHDKSEGATGTGASKRPHVRKAHYHSFWTGPRDNLQERRLHVKWLPPIPVNVSDSDDLVPTMHKVVRNGS